MEPHRIGFQVDALLAPEQALTRYFDSANLRAPLVEYVSLDRAFGRVLAEPLVADSAYPAAARSAMDGFALRAQETPGRFAVAGEIRMGHAWESPLAPRTAVRIPTGGVVPTGADAVVPIEDVRSSGGGIEVTTALEPGDCITPAGSDMRAGELLLRSGRRIGGPESALCATLGVMAVPVFKKPVFAVISSGDELIDPAGTPSPAQVRDSNRWGIAATLEALGAAVRHAATAPDEPARLEALLREALATSDGVFLTGGSSVGERDLTPRIVERLGKPGVIVHGLRVKPGKPTVLGAVDGKPVIGLPGNPTSALMILEAVAQPIVRALCGGGAHTAGVPATLAQRFSKRAGWTWFVPVRLEHTAGGPLAHPLEMRSSSVSLMARASGFLELGEEVHDLPAGTQVEMRRFAAGGEQ
jgi:putative molybdopterin biosynthesis protein